MSAVTVTAIFATPCGHDRHGFPLPERPYLIDREPEDWGDGRSRIFHENRSMRHPDGQFIFTPVVVATASIRPAARVSS